MGGRTELRPAREAGLTVIRFGKMMHKMKKLLRLAFIVSVLLISLLPLTSASANSAPPPSELWFTFDFKSDEPITVESFTLVLCTDEQCSYSIAVTQVPNSAGMPYANELYCYENWCKWRMYPPGDSYSVLPDVKVQSSWSFNNANYFQVDIQFPDGIRKSNILHGFPGRYGAEAHFNISQNEGDLLLIQDKDFREPFLSGEFRSFLLTLLVEPLVFAIFMWLWKRETFRTVLHYYLLFLLANGISYPMLWGFFPSITAYHYERVETTGALYLIGGLTVSALLMLSVYFKGTVSEGLRGFAIILVPFLCFLIFTASFRYGVYPEPIAPTGIPISSAIMLIEVFAVAFESIFVYSISQKKISFMIAFIGCIFANAASFGLGLVLL